MKIKILKELSKITTPSLKGDIISLDLVSDVIIRDNKVMFSITVPNGLAKEMAYARDQAERMVAKVEGVERVLIALTAETVAPAPKTIPRLKKRNQERPVGPDMRPKAGEIPGVKSIVAVASGKGGVGKSTTAVNLRWHLRRLV